MVKEAKHIYLADLHFEHKVWLNEFDFFKDEIQIFRYEKQENVLKMWDWKPASAKISAGKV